LGAAPAAAARPPDRPVSNTRRTGVRTAGRRDVGGAGAGLRPGRWLPRASGDGRRADTAALGPGSARAGGAGLRRRPTLSAGPVVDRRAGGRKRLPAARPRLYPAAAARRAGARAVEMALLRPRP